MSKLVVAALSSAFAFLALALAPASARAMQCAPARARLFAADGQAEVYITQEPYFEVGTHERLGMETVYRGCVYGSRRSFRLGIVEEGSSSGGVATNHVTLSGVDVAYETLRSSGEVGGLVTLESHDYVVVRNLRTGRVLYRVPDGIALEAVADTVGIGYVEKIVLKSDGAVAWIARDDLRSDEFERETGRMLVSYYDLYALDSTGEHLLASGIELDPSSLALAGSTLYWTEDGKPFSALLH